MISRAGAVALGLLVDRTLGEPPNPYHPVAWFGSAMLSVERWLWPVGAQETAANARPLGATYAVTGVGLGAAAGVVVRNTSVAVAVSVAGRELRRVADRIADAADRGGLDAARAELPSLVGRDPSELDASGIAAAVIESVAENSVDAVVAPVFWALVAGAPGALAYRAVNTMDAMVGHRSPRYERFGTAAARLDDVANYVPARLFALTMMVSNPRKARLIARTVRRDARHHPSPNAGVAESAMAAAIGRQLGGPLRYGERVEDRPFLGDGARPVPSDIGTATRLAGRAELLIVGLLAAVEVVRRSASRRPSV